MDDYAAAYKERVFDTEALHRATRTVGAVHVGGVTIECILKDMIKTYHGITEWGQQSQRTGTIIRNPEHNLTRAINSIDVLSTRLRAHPVMERNLAIIKRPVNGYVQMRYVGGEIEQTRYQEWYDAYNGMKRWLIQQKRDLSI